MGQQPPTLVSRETEQSLLGCLLIDPDAYMRDCAGLRTEDFAENRHQVIYGAIEMCAMGGGIDILALTNLLEAQGKLLDIGGRAYLSHLVNSSWTQQLFLKRHVEKAQALSERRQLAAIGESMVVGAYNLQRSPSATLAAIESKLLGMASDTDTKSSISAAHLAADLTTQIGAFISGQARWNVVPTGIAPLDECLAGGLEPGVYIIAGRAGIGKTSAMLQIAANIAAAGKRIAIFTIEMSRTEIGLRLASGISRVPLRALKAGNTTSEENGRIMRALGTISEWPMHIDDRSTLRATDVLLAAQRIALEHKDLAAVFVDGLWLMVPDQRYNGNRVQELGSISKGIKRVQRHLDVPIVITHQLSRGPEHRTDKRPLLSDLRNSGAVEQDSDVVLMLYRDNYYDVAAESTAEIWIRKNRLGGESNEMVKLYWVQKYGRFERLEYGPTPEGGE